MKRRSLLSTFIDKLYLLRQLISHRLYILLGLDKQLIDQFTIFYYEEFLFHKFVGYQNVPFWLGVSAGKMPTDLWVYQEILWEKKPDIIIECGTADAGSTLFLASICDFIKKGRVISIDIKKNNNRPKHKRITYLQGSSTTSRIEQQVKKYIKKNDKVMVILDSDHSKNHVLNELKIYSKLVTTGDYLIVEDTNLNGHPVLPHFGPGPWEALEEFLKYDKHFVIDETKNKFCLTFNPHGYLKRVH